MNRLAVNEVGGALGEAITRVSSDGERIILHQQGKDLAVLISVEDLALLEEIEDRIDLDQARKVLDDPNDEVLDWEDAKKELDAS